MLQANSGRSNKQQQEHNSPNLAKAEPSTYLIVVDRAVQQGTLQILSGWFSKVEVTVLVDVELNFGPGGGRDARVGAGISRLICRFYCNGND